MTRISIVAASTIVVSAIAFAQPPPDRDVLAKIRTEGLDHSQVAPVFQMLTVDIGPRLTASPAHKRAVEWTRDRLASYGLANVTHHTNMDTNERLEEKDLQQAAIVMAAFA